MAEPNRSKDRLALSALGLFAERGFVGTSIRDIAKATGLSISNIYHHFGNKEGLLLAILKTASERLLHELQEASNQPGTPIERFKRLVQTHLQLSRGLRKEAKIFFLDEEHLSPEGYRANLKYQREILDLYREHLLALQEAGEVNFKSPTIAAFNILGVVNWHLRWYRPEGQMSFEETSREVTEFILHGISRVREP
ncbi:MAG: TetR family transcriptional regulator [Proteobacteria bacterium]|nr:TetR family transcriptional regulator [Pseudomonadota bacterium]MBU4275388.1 TetR family transcriptional regulator [Pseudomonadota bacterium]MBU4382665.1 TetR family transcriptional regulator [Pseudomonadota bacterium]MBU4604436.1 TetR family transcriptional regulator [Pseudomonadota bacterium]MCG2765179.1 TetR family transcriptional regulator [Desulfarculaceae bacterium]